MLLLLLSIHDLLQPFVPIDVLYLIEFTQVRVGFKNRSILEPYVLQVARVCSIRGTEQSGTLGRLLKVSEATVNLSLPVQMPSFFLT